MPIDETVEAAVPRATAGGDGDGMTSGHASVAPGVEVASGQDSQPTPPTPAPAVSGGATERFAESCIDGFVVAPALLSASSARASPTLFVAVVRYPMQIQRGSQC